MLQDARVDAYIHAIKAVCAREQELYLTPEGLVFVGEPSYWEILNPNAASSFAVWVQVMLCRGGGQTIF